MGVAAAGLPVRSADFVPAATGCRPIVFSFAAINVPYFCLDVFRGGVRITYSFEKSPLNRFNGVQSVGVVVR